MPRLALLGTCVTRDPLSTEMQVVRYIARTTFTSMLAAPTLLGEFNLPSSGSAFMDRCLSIDFEKSHIAFLKEAKPDYLLIDCIDERCGHYIRGEQIVTHSETMLYSLKDLPTKLKERGFTYESRENLSVHTRGVIDFSKVLDRLMLIIPRERIIFHDARWVENYRNAAGTIIPFQNLHKIAEHNRRLGEYALAAEKKLGKDLIISIAKNFVADEKHQWKLAPYHYEPDYNTAFRHELLRIMG